MSLAASAKMGFRPATAASMALRSAREFPLQPAPEAIAAIYRECRAALVSANVSRGVLKAQSDRRGVVIQELQREMQELEADLSDQARAKARLHAMNSKLVGVIRELESTGDAMVEAIEESERQSGFWLVRMFQELVRLARRWRQAKATATQLAAAALAPEPFATESGPQHAPAPPEAPTRLPLKL
jgi:sugar-specific transcriptional regulator TrmB